jgi:ABC-type lipoprotein release transport system permease subunit
MYKFTLAIRYLIRRRISYFAVAAVALCVFVVFVVITVLSGLSRDFKYKVYSSVGDCVVHTKSLVGFGYYEDFLDILADQDYIEAATPIIKNFGLVSVTETGGLDVYGESTREIVGIEPVSLSKVMGFGRWIEYHKDNVADVFRPAYDVNLPGCVPGIDVIFNKDQQGNYNTTGRLVRTVFEISCVPLTAKGALAKVGAGEFNSKTFYYSDHFEAGYSLDRRLIFLPIEDVQLLCGMATGHKRITHIHIKFKEGVGVNNGTQKVKKLWTDFIAGKEGERYANLLQAVRVQNWKDFSKMIVALVETQQTMVIVSFALIGIIAVFIVLVVFYMIVSHKSKDIGILKSVGASGPNILSLFLNFAFLIGIIGSAIGALGGWGFLVHINSIEDWLFEKYEFQLWDRQISSIGDIPNEVDLTVLAAIILCAVAACLIGALLPSWRASRTKCVDTLQVAQL